MKNPFDGVFNQGKEEETEEAEKPEYTGEQELEVSRETGEVRSKDREELDKTFEDR
jgi:hypothetical protein